MSLSRLANAPLRPARFRPSTGADPLLRAAPQRRPFTQGPDNLGGPGGQEPPPPNPGGVDVLKRRWMPIVGGGLLAVAGMAYLLRSPEEVNKGREKVAEGTEKLKEYEAKVQAELTGKK
ncbi:hypothetical protein S40293_10792 [Stachybotrys chartarum IBT 40293]|nr:hypothetical protein S40293_10792 [Stachybotrys chartarum IBT 40293]